MGSPGDHCVHVIYGTSKGLTSGKTQELWGATPDIASADFDGNGADDLAMRGGGVNLYFGDSDGLPIWPQPLDDFLMPGLTQGDEAQRMTALVGNALAADDFEGNYPLAIHEVFGAAEKGDRFGEVFAH